MIYASCIACRRAYDAGPGSGCPRCPPHRIAAAVQFSVCQTNRCGHYLASQHGCAHLATPCHLRELLIRRRHTCPNR